MTRTSARPAGLALLLFALAGSLTGCAATASSPPQVEPATSRTSEDPAASTASAVPGAPTTAATEGSPGTGQAAGSAAPPGVDAGTPVATRTVTENGFRLALDVYPLASRGRTVALNLRLRVLAVPSDPMASADMVLSDSTSPIGQPWNGLRVVDEQHAMVHLPASAAGRTLCAPEFHGGWQKGDQYWVSCLFGAMPSGVSEATVTAGSFGSFGHVPVG